MEFFLSGSGRGDRQGWREILRARMNQDKQESLRPSRSSVRMGKDEAYHSMAEDDLVAKTVRENVRMMRSVK
jgi:hypothetical protein